MKSILILYTGEKRKETQLILVIHGNYVPQSCHELWISKHWIMVPGGNTGANKALVTFSSADQYITFLYVCLPLKIPYFIYINVLLIH